LAKAPDIAGKNIASESSLRQAIYLAADIIENRKNHAEYGKNPLRTKYQKDQSKDDDISQLETPDNESTDGLSI